MVVMRKISFYLVSRIGASNMRRGQFWLQVLPALLIALATLTSPLFAQVKSSAITGTVSDTSGAVLPGAKVTVTETGTRTVNTTQTNEVGQYNVPYLPIGKYTVEVAMEGFQTFRKTDIDLAGGTTLRNDVALQVGSTTEAVEVMAEALAIQVENATIATAVNAQQIRDLPNINGNSLYFATLDSGVVGTPNAQSSTNVGVGYADRRNMSGLRINGGEIGSNDVQLDGNSVQGAAWRETAVIPNPDALSEVRVVTNNFTAETGLAQGVIQQTTKGGTNALHGSGNFMLRNEAFNANAFGNNLQGIPRPKYRLFQGGGSAGGPVIKDKLFFFTSFLRLTQTTSQTFTATVPTLLERQGDFSQTYLADASGKPAPVTIYNPFTATAINSTQYSRQAYANNIVSNPNPYGLKILQAFPVPNYGPFGSTDPRLGVSQACTVGSAAICGGGGTDLFHADNYRYDGTIPQARNSLQGRVDYKPTNSQSIYFTFGVAKGHRTNPNQWGSNANGPWVLQSNMGDILDKNPYGAIGDTIILGPTSVLDVRYGVTHINTQAQVRTAKGDPLAYGQPAAVAAVAPFGPGVLPNVNAIGTYTALNSNNFGNKKEHQLNHSLNASLTKVTGNLTMKFGTEFRVYLQNFQDNQVQSPILSVNNVTGQVGDSSGATVNSAVPNLQNRGFTAAALAAGVGAWTMSVGNNPVLAVASKYLAFYEQNTWRTTQKLTLSLGIRYDVQPGPTERYNRMSSYILDKQNPFASGSQICVNTDSTGKALVVPVCNAQGGLGYLTFPGVDGSSRHLYETTWNNIAPRVGATYQLSRNTVLRGGYGRNYLPANTGYNANTTIYNPVPWDNAVNPFPYGLNPNGVPVGTFDNTENSIVIRGAGPVQDATNYGQPTGVTIFNRKQYKTGHTDQWNFFIERQLSPTWLVNVGYVGSKSGTLPWRGFLINSSTQAFAVDPATRAAWRASYLATGVDPATVKVNNPLTALVGKAPCNAACVNTTTITALQAAQPYLAALNTTSFLSVGESNYHAFQVKVQHATSHGLSFSGNYTWSKSTGLLGGNGNQTFAESQAGSANSAGATGGVDYANLQNNRGLADYDIPHRAVFTGSYDLPIGKGKAFDPGNGILNSVVGGWQTAFAINLQSGYPWAPSCGTLNYNGRCNRVAGQPLELPEKDKQYWNGKDTLTLPDGRVITPQAFTFTKWNPDAWAAPSMTLPNGTIVADPYTAGTSSLTYGFLRTPGIQNVNLSLIKRIRLTERVGFDLHVNATNAFNHANHNTVNNTVTLDAKTGSNANPAFGTWGVSTLNAREIVIQTNLIF